MLKDQDASQTCATMKWFHAIDFGDFASTGRFAEGTPQNTTLYGAFEFLKSLDLQGTDFLDIGTFDGIVAFGAAALGAQVQAVDTYDQPTFRFARKRLGLEDKVTYTPGVQIANLSSLFRPKTFDCIVCAGVFYHMLYPMQSYVEPRKLLRDGGYLIMETPFHDGREDAALLFNPVEKVTNEYYTYFVPTRRALISMANLAGFRVVAERVLEMPRRITLLLQAVPRSELINDPATPRFLAEVIERDTCDDAFRFKDLEAIEAPVSKISLKKDIAGHRMINSRKEAVDFPYHPPADKPAFGIRRHAS